MKKKVFVFEENHFLSNRILFIASIVTAALCPIIGLLELQLGQKQSRHIWTWTTEFTLCSAAIWRISFMSSLLAEIIQASSEGYFHT